MTTEITPPTEPTTTAEDIEQNKIFGILAYLSILWLVPLLAAKESKFARYHTNEGFVLLLLGLFMSVGLGIIAAPLSLIPVLGWLLLSLFPLLWIGYVVLVVIGVINAAQGKMKPLPVIGGRFSIIKA